MNGSLFRNTVLTGWMSLAVVACGSGGMGGGAASGMTGVSAGPVTSFGSVFVNGVEFRTNGGSVELNGTPGPDEMTDPHRGLKVGMIVEVEGSFDDSGTAGGAASITYKDNLEGPIASISGTTTRTAVVLGQTVMMDSQTVFESPLALNTIQQGDFIEVSGLVDDTGSIHATYVELIPPGAMEVKGTIQNLTATTFQIHLLTVDYASATHLPSGGLATGQFVEVQGTSSDGGVTLTATTVELDDDTLGAMDAGKVEIEGFVTRLTSPTEFTVGTQAVQTTGSTVYQNGTAGDIALGRRMEVDGPLAGGVVTGTKVSFH